MSAMRRLVLDLSLWVWAYLLFMISVGILLDVGWLHSPRPAASPLMAGFFLNLGAMQSAQKVALWRTLPVSRRQIDLARWLQGVAAPVLLLALMMFLPAVILAGAHLLHAGPSAIALMAAAQAGSGVLLFAMSVALPGLRSRIGRLSGMAWLLLVFMIVFAPRFLQTGSLKTGMEGMAALGLVAAMALYGMAGRWPLPMTGWTSFWSPPRSEVSKPPAPPGHAGWPALVRAQAPAVLIGWCMIPGVPLVLRSAFGMPHMDLSFMALYGFLIGAMLPAMVLANGLRALRGLPLTGLGLTLRLTVPLVMIQLLGAAIYAMTVSWLQPELPLRAGYILLPVAAPVLILATGLRFGPRVGQFAVGITIAFAAFGSMLLLYLDFSLAQTALLVAGLTGLGIVAVWREIASGRHAYRGQPLMPISWSGR